VLTACEDPTTFVPTNSDEFSYYDQDLYNQANDVLQADYLFVADYSYSMHDKVETLVNSMDLFAEDLKAKNIDYRIGFVRGTTSTNGDTYTYIPKTLVGPAISKSSINLQSLIDLQLDGFASANAANGRFLLESARRVATNPRLSFIRDASQLVYVFISDNDDVSVNDPNLASRTLSSYVESLRVKSDNSYINARAWVTGASTGCAVGTEFGNGAGTRLATAARALNSGTSEAVQCLSDANSMASSLEDLARNVTRPTKRFKLRAPPVANTIVVKVDGVTQALGSSWDYVAASREVVFRNGSEPDAGSELEINYSPLLKLSGSPDVATLVITVDGVEILKSDSEGWRFNAANNQLLFTGSYKPADGAIISATYQAK
jgi:uncharacterized protein YcfJ